MDLSKLPKLSQTPQQPDSGEPMPEPGVPAGTVDYRGPGTTAPIVPISGGEVWFATIVGLVFIFLSRSFPSWLICKLTGRVFTTGVIWSVGPNAGQPADYWELAGHTALSDMAIFLFGIAVIVEALMFFVWLRNPTRLKAIIWLALMATALATGLNIVTSLILFSEGITPLLSLLAAAFGGWMFFQQLGLLSWIRQAETVRPLSGSEPT